LYRGISAFNDGYKPRINVIKDDKGDLFTDSYSTVASWSKLCCQPLNAFEVSDVRQRDIHTADPVVPEPSAFEL